jgi:hypothetical protein
MEWWSIEMYDINTKLGAYESQFYSKLSAWNRVVACLLFKPFLFAKCLKYVSCLFFSAYDLRCIFCDHAAPINKVVGIERSDVEYFNKDTKKYTF